MVPRRELTPSLPQVKGAKLAVSLTAGFCSDWTAQSDTNGSGDGAQPFCR